MNEFFASVATFSNFLWGGNWGDVRILPVGVVTIALLGTGLFFMIRLGFRPLRRIGPAFAVLWSGRKAEGAGEITPWQAVSTALSGQVGTGNLAGVATAITLGGPGAIFWMWVTAIVGMAAAFAETSLAVRYREQHPTATSTVARCTTSATAWVAAGVGSPCCSVSARWARRWSPAT
jgi:alanine or glycine:cation symporter, AGCS family